jgi:adenylosuccinate lyase
MELNTLTAISPVDGRYRKQVAHLDEYFSEYALIKYRLRLKLLILFSWLIKSFLSCHQKQNKT